MNAPPTGHVDSNPTGGTYLWMWSLTSSLVYLLYCHVVWVTHRKEIKLTALYLWLTCLGIAVPVKRLVS